MISVEKIEGIVSEYITSSEYFLVDVKVSSNNIIEVLIDNIAGVDITYCIELSRHIEGFFDREVEDFELTVASAGISDPFKKLQQYYKFEGKEVDIVANTGAKFTGVLENVNDEGFEITFEVKELIEGKKRKQVVVKRVAFAYVDVKSTRVVVKF